jgi:hypothetical protein
MNNNRLFILCHLFLAFFCCFLSHPQNLTAAAPAPGQAAPKVTQRNPPFVGVVQKVDKTVGSITLNGKDGGRVFYITLQTKITKNGQPATLADAKLGEEAAGTFRDEGGKRLAVSLRLGPKPEKTPAKK